MPLSSGVAGGGMGIMSTIIIIFFFLIFALVEKCQEMSLRWTILRPTNFDRPFSPNVVEREDTRTVT